MSGRYYGKRDDFPERTQVIPMKGKITGGYLKKISHIELKQLEYQKSTDERFDKVFQYIEDHAESMQYKL